MILLPGNDLLEELETHVFDTKTNKHRYLQWIEFLRCSWRCSYGGVVSQVHDLKWLLQPPDDMNVLEQLFTASDRATGVILIGFLDTWMLRLIASRFVSDEACVKSFTKGRGPLSSLSSRNDFLYLSGVISEKTRRDIHSLKEIRNKFAHEPTPYDFSSQTIRSHMGNITLPERVASITHDALKGVLGDINPVTPINFTNPKPRFVRTVQILNILFAHLSTQAPRFDGPFF